MQLQRKKKCNIDHVPRFTGLAVKPIWPLTEECAKALLMIHSPGTWTTVDDLKRQFVDFITAFADFVDNSSHCPHGLKEILKMAKSNYDKKQNRMPAQPRH